MYIAPAFVQVSPSFVDPAIIMPYFQASGAFDLLAGGAPRVSLGEGDLFVYLRRIDLRTQIMASQNAVNQLPGVQTTLSQLSTPTYLLRVRGEYDHHDAAAMARNGLSIEQTQRLGMRQAHFQLMRNALLDGFNPAGGEGLLNTQGATATNLPPDSNGATTVTGYDSGEMAFFFLATIQALKTRTNQMGIGREITILGPQRILGQFEYQGIVELTQFQRVGAGSSSAADLIKEIAARNGDTITWVYDDTLKGKGTNGTDAVIICMPQVQKPVGGAINTNEFAKLAPGMDANTLMYMDQAAPREIPTPLPGGAIDTVSEIRITSGWGVRGEAITIISAAP